MCKDCEARQKLAREAFQKASFAQALGHVAKGAAEMVGIKNKTGEAELKARSTKRRKPNSGAAG